MDHIRREPFFATSNGIESLSQWYQDLSYYNFNRIFKEFHEITTWKMATDWVDRYIAGERYDTRLELMTQKCFDSAFFV
jgi:hypothetical protein